MKAKISILEEIAYLFTCIGFIVMIVFIINLSSSYSVGGHLSNDEMAITGQVGDFMGGVIGSIWALAGVFLYFFCYKNAKYRVGESSKIQKGRSYTGFHKGI